MTVQDQRIPLTCQRCQRAMLGRTRARKYCSTCSDVIRVERTARNKQRRLGHPWPDSAGFWRKANVVAFDKLIEVVCIGFPGRVCGQLFRARSKAARHCQACSRWNKNRGEYLRKKAKRAKAAAAK